MRMQISRNLLMQILTNKFCRTIIVFKKKNPTKTDFLIEKLDPSTVRRALQVFGTTEFSWS